MTSTVAHPSDYDSSPAPEDHDHESASRRSSLGASIIMNERGNGDDSGNDDAVSPMTNTSTTSKKSNSSELSSSSTTASNGAAASSSGDRNKKRSIGEMSSLGFSPSSTSASTSWQEFCRKGTRFKTLLDDALVKVTSAAATASIDSSSSQHHQPQQQSSGEGQEGVSFHATNSAINVNSDTTSGGSILQKLVREKQTECLLLQQKVDSQHSEMTQLQAIVDDLRESKKQQAGNETRLRIALKRASQNASLAR